MDLTREELDADWQLAQLHDTIAGSFSELIPNEPLYRIKQAAIAWQVNLLHSDEPLALVQAGSERMEPGDAARLLLERLEQHGRLTRARRRILENMPEHGHQMTQSHASNFYTMMGWLERWWPGLREY